MDASGLTVDLIRKCEAGDVKAENELFRRYYPVVRNIVRMRVGRSAGGLEGIDDLVQDSMLDAFRSLRQFTYRSEGSFRHWLARAVENNVLDAVRRGSAQKRGPGRVKQAADLASSSTSLTEYIFPEAGPSPSEVVRNADSEKALRTYLEQHLEEPYLAIVVLRNFCALSFQEIATELRYEKTSTVRSIHVRALAKIREALAVDSAGLL